MKTRRIEYWVTGICFLIVAVFPTVLDAAELGVVITDEGLEPNHIVLQVGDRVTFSAPPGHGSAGYTIVIVDRIGGKLVEQRVETGPFSYQFEKSGRFHLFVKEVPSIQASAVVFAKGGGDSELREEMVSYSIGYDLGLNVVRKLENLNLKLFTAGLEHAYRDQEPKLSWAEMDFIVNEYSREVTRLTREERERTAARNLLQGRRFLEKNARRDEVVTLPSGLQYEVLRSGSGMRPDIGTAVVVQYAARFLDGTKFDDTHETQPAEFVLTENVLPGYSEGLRLMSAGARWVLFVPPQLAYGSQGRPSPLPGSPVIEPNATLIFDVELITVGEAGGNQQPVE